MLSKMPNLQCLISWVLASHFYLKQHFLPRESRFWFSLAPPLALCVCVCVCVCESLNEHLSREPGTKLLDMPLGNKKKNITTLTCTAMLLWVRWAMTFLNLRISYSRTSVLNLDYTSWYTSLNLPVNPTDILKGHIGPFYFLNLFYNIVDITCQEVLYTFGPKWSIL